MLSNRAHAFVALHIQACFLSLEEIFWLELEERLSPEALLLQRSSPKALFEFERVTHASSKQPQRALFPKELFEERQASQRSSLRASACAKFCRHACMSLFFKKIHSAEYVTLHNVWERQDSNLRWRKPADLQSVALNHSATFPSIVYVLFLQMVVKYD